MTPCWNCGIVLCFAFLEVPGARRFMLQAVFGTERSRMEDVSVNPPEV